MRLLITAAVTVAAMADDIRRYRISNKISIACFVAGMILFGAEGLLEGNFLKLFYEYVVGGVTAFLVMFMAYILMAVGAGDVKLCGALGLLVGMKGICSTIVWAFVYTGVAGIVGMFFKKCRIKQTAVGKVHTIHFSVALLVGEIITYYNILFIGEVMN